MYNAMAKVEIYTWRTCPFCVRAKGLLDRKGVSYTEHSVDGDEPGRDVAAADIFRERGADVGQHVALCRRGEVFIWLAHRFGLGCGKARL